MTHIVVSDDQAQIIFGSTESIEIRDRNGRHLGFFEHDFTADDVAIARQRMASDEPRFSTRQVLDHLDSLDPR